MPDDAPSDTLRRRAAGSRLRLWFLLDADRRLVTGLLVVVVFAAILLAGLVAPGAAATARSTDSVDTLFQALLTATITGVTLVLTLNQLVLSQELGAVGDQRDRMEAAMAFRDDAADVVDASVAPAQPAQFLRAFVQVAGDRARDLRAAAPADAPLADDVDRLTDSLVENAERVSTDLEGATFGEFEVVSAALDFNYSWKVFAARRIAAQHGDDLPPEASEALDRLMAVLRLFGPAREHFKTLYFQWELIDLSRAILVAAVPALVVSAFMVAFFRPASVAGSVLGVDVVVLAVAVAATVALVPFLLLLAYVLRIATVTKHTLSIGPFILRETEEVAEVAWNGEDGNE
jgi:hypothetical protein